MVTVQLTEQEVHILKDLLEQSLDVQHQYLKTADPVEERETIDITRAHMIELDRITLKLS